jgi:hypothetical protein
MRDSKMSDDGAPLELLRELDSIPLSRALGRALVVARSQDLDELARWCQLELGGYLPSNGAMGDDVTVPEYRTVVGKYLDASGRPYIVEPQLNFIQQTRLRNPVAELEALSTRGPAVTQEAEPWVRESIQQTFKADVYAFRYSTVHVEGVLSAIRLEMANRLAAAPILISESPDSAQRGSGIAGRTINWPIAIALAALLVTTASFLIGPGLIEKIAVRITPTQVILPTVPAPGTSLPSQPD